MTTTQREDAVPGVAAPSSPAGRIGAVLALATTVVGVLAVGSGYGTPPQSLLVLLAVALLVCIHYAAVPATRVVSGIALVLGGVAAAALLVDYAVQLAALQPSLRRGETAGLSALTQYNPHGVFIALEDLGYLLLGLALLVVAFVFPRTSRLERGLRWLFLAGGALTVVALPAFAAGYGGDLDYRYEVTGIGLTWVTLVVGGVLLFLWFRRTGTSPAASATPSDGGNPA